MRETIQQGGDTDTNACIVGGMIGALVGIHNIDPHYVKTLLTFDCTSKEPSQVYRPQFLSVKYNAVRCIDKLIKSRPRNKLKITQEQVDIKSKNNEMISHF